MNKRKKSLTGPIILSLAAILLAVFVWWNWTETREAAGEQTQTQTQAQTEPETQAAGPTIPLMDFAGLLAQNPEIVGRLVIEGIGLDYPLVQGADNSYYLTHTAEKKYNAMGALFLDYRADRNFADFKTVVYGHYTKSGKMFGKLHHLREQTEFDQVTGGMLYTPEKTSRLEIFAALLTPATSEFYHRIFFSESSREKHLDAIREQAVCYRDIGVTAEDRLLLLSTCSYEYEGARTVIIARIVP